MATEKLSQLLTEIRACKHCEADLPLGARPVLAASQTAKILLVGQAPGIRVHGSGIPWDDASGKRLRQWMGVSEDDFYDESKIAIVPMGFCYPGTGSTGDLPPRKECATLWHDRLIAQMTEVKLTIVMGRYALTYVLGGRQKRNLTETVADWKSFTPDTLPLPHPSPRNNRWLKKNAWFESDVLPWLKRRVKKLMK